MTHAYDGPGCRYDASLCKFTGKERDSESGGWHTHLRSVQMSGVHVLSSQTTQRGSRSVRLVPTRLKRYYNTRHHHFITTSCYHRMPRLARADSRDLLLQMLEETRRNYRFVVVGYVVMPEHFHLLMSEPDKGDPSVVMKVLKERFARALHKKEGSDERVWQKRFYDFNVWSAKKEIEKLRYMHRNPVKRELVAKPEEWVWSSYRWYAYGEIGKVRVNVQEWPMEIRRVARQQFGERIDTPLICTERK